MALFPGPQENVVVMPGFGERGRCVRGKVVVAVVPGDLGRMEWWAAQACQLYLTAQAGWGEDSSALIRWIREIKVREERDV